MTWLGPYLAGCLLLVGAGVAKARRPQDTARALAALRPGTPLGPVVWAVRLGATAEAALGALALVEPRRTPAVLVALSYAAFAGFVALARARGGVLATCGCFGTPDTPPTRLHISLDAVLALAAGGVALAAPAGALPGVLARQPLHGVPLVVGAVLGAYLAVGAMTLHGRLLASRQLLAARPMHPPGAVAAGHGR